MFKIMLSIEIRKELKQTVKENHLINYKKRVKLYMKFKNNILYIIQ